jgi:hypothetical protein
MHRKHIFTAVGLLSLGVSAAAARAQTASQPAASAITTTETYLRLATSEDGLAFADAGQPFKIRGVAPDLIRVPSGRLLVVFQSPGRRSDEPPILLAAQSRDEGRTWSEPRRLELHVGEGRQLRVSSPALALLRDGTLRLYFCMRTEKGVAIGSAASRDGITYDFDRDFWLPFSGTEDVRVRVAWIGRRLNLFIVPRQAEGRPAEGGVQYASSDGRRFYRLGKRLAPAGTIRVVALGGGQARVFVEAEGGLRSMAGDGVRWRDEGAARIPGKDFAAIRLEDRKYLALYARATPRGVQDSEAAQVADSGQANGSEEWAPFEPNGLTEDAFELAMPPIPDFTNQFDYVQWARDNVGILADGENAYDAYAAFMRRSLDQGPNKVPDEINDMLNGGDGGPPGPWDPSQHANWEATHQSIQPLLEQFRQACQLDSYYHRIEFTQEQYAKAPDGRPLLFDLWLPTLRDHRAMVKAELADSWRAENGQASPPRMIQAWETSLRAADHMLQGPTLIHNLVGIAEQVVVEENARRALCSGTWSADQLQAALETLRAYDRPAANPTECLVFESAGFMDAWQRICKPDTPGGPPKVNADILRQVSPEYPHPELAELTPEQIRAALQKSDAYFREATRLWRTGYPTVRAADAMAAEDKYVQDNPLNIFLPSVSRPLVMQARSDAQRRGTQLTYALHLYHAQTGRWPNTLDELPAELGETMKTDPFTGRQFQYRITPGGPTVYSLSENGVDDGGVHSKRWEESKDENGGSDDFVFWPMQK